MKDTSKRATTGTLYTRLRPFRSVVPAGPNSGGESSVIIDAIEYIGEMKQQIEHLSSEVEAMSNAPSFLLPSHSASPYGNLQLPTNVLSSGRTAAESHVEVIALDTALDIHISCPKRPGLMVSIVSALEKSGLIVAKMDIRCSEVLEFDAFYTESCEGRVIDAEAVRKMLLWTIMGHRNGDAV